MVESNRPYQPIQSNISGHNTVMNGVLWGAGSSALAGAAYSAANEYALKGDLAKMGKLDSHIPSLIQSYRGAEKAMRGYDNIQNHTTAEKGVMGQKSPLTKMMYNSTFAHGWGANARRVGVMAAIGAVMGGLHNASDGVVGR